MPVIKLIDLHLQSKRVFIRADLNVPIKDGLVTSDARITASMTTINYCLKKRCQSDGYFSFGSPGRGCLVRRKFA